MIGIEIEIEGNSAFGAKTETEIEIEGIGPEALKSEELGMRSGGAQQTAFAGSRQATENAVSRFPLMGAPQ